jgi:hypothetical protein
MRLIKLVRTVIFVTSLLSCGNSYSVLWEAKNAGSQQVPDKFIYILFPKDNQITLEKENGDSSGVVLSRAILCSEKELREGNRIGVWHNNEEFSVGRKL